MKSKIREEIEHLPRKNIKINLNKKEELEEIIREEMRDFKCYSK